jgi:hypothetical protein
MVAACRPVAVDYLHNVSHYEVYLNLCLSYYLSVCNTSYVLQIEMYLICHSKYFFLVGKKYDIFTIIHTYFLLFSIKQEASSTTLKNFLNMCL